MTTKDPQKEDSGKKDSQKEDSTKKKDVKKEDPGKKKKPKSSKLGKLKALVAKAQSIFAVGIFFHLLAISYFKATIVYVLRFQCKLNENQSIMCFHLFQVSTYVSTYLFGIIMSYSHKAAFILMMIFYMIGGAVMTGALLIIPNKPTLLPFIPYAIIVFGFGVGTYKATIPKVLSTSYKALEGFFICMITELVLEVLLIGIASMFLLNFEVHIFAGLYVISLLVIVAASIDPMNDPKHHSEKAFKYANVVNCMMFGLWKLLASQAAKLSKKKKDKKDDRHWLYQAEKKFGKDLVEALIIKFTLHKFYLWIAGIWVAVELKYSYWIFAAYLTDRRLFGSFVIQPAQFLAIPPLIAVLVVPLYVFWLRPALSHSYYNNGTRKMCLGAAFLLFATALSWRLSARLGDVSTEFMEPDFKHTEVRIINGHFCPSGILHYFPIDMEVAKVVYPRPAIETAYPVKGNNEPNIGMKKEIETVVIILTPLNEDTYLKYANLPIEQEGVGELEATTMQPSDSFTYLKRLGTKLDNAVTVMAFGYCDTLSKFTLDIPMDLRRKAVDHSDVFLLRQSNDSAYVLYEDLDYEKSPLLQPGVRIYVISGDKAVDVELKRGEETLVRMEGNGAGKPSDMIWLNVGDGPNLEIHALKKVVKFTHRLGPSEMIDLVVQVDQGKVAVKMLYVEPPLLRSGVELLPQYFLAIFGELLVGVVGLQYLIGACPPKMQYYVYMDWYLMLGFANGIIIAVNQMPWSVLHNQLSYLTMCVGISYCFLIVMASRF